MAGQANDSEKLPWLEPYREPEEQPRRAAKPAKLKSVKPADAAKPALPKVKGPASSPPRKGVPLAAWLATGAVVVALAAGGGYWAGNRNAPATDTPAPTITIPVAKVDPIPMPEVDAPAVTDREAAPSRPARIARKATAPRKNAVRRPGRRAVAESPPARPDAAPPMPKVMSVNLIPRGSAGPPGTIVDLGRYLSPQLADSAFRVTATRYPYLGKLQRVVVPLPPVYGQPRLYALQVGAKSSREARILCENLIKIGRPCDVR